MTNRRQFLKGIGLFSILAGAGRVWKAAPAVERTTVLVPASEWTRLYRSPHFEFLPSFQDFLAQNDKLLQRMDGDELFKPTSWPANMGDVQRVIERTTIEPISPGLFRQTRKPLTIDDII